ncbi:MAG: type VI secretion system tip protein VgrG [Saprospiraceae bacterium]|nr:type VI secretion system tip protein VgrG [Saprospiraceae bacterium]
MTQRTIPNDSSHDVNTFDILTDEQAMPPAMQVLSISVHKELNRIPFATVIVRDGDPAAETFELSESDFFKPGKKIHIKLGRDSQNKTAFKGIIVKHSIKIREDGNSQLIIEARDETVKMTIGRHSKYYEEQKDSEVIEQLIGKHGLQKDVEATQLKHKELVQYHSTDWDFMLSRAELNGKMVNVSDGKVEVKKPNTSASAALSLLFGATLLEFEAEMDARNQWKAAEAKSWDYTNQSLFEQKSESSPVREPGNISGSQLSEAINLAQWELRSGGQALEQELKAWTEAAMQKSRLSKICGRAKFLGFPDIKPGQTVDLKGLGARFNGVAFVSAVRHQVSGGAWDTHVQFGLKPEWFTQQRDIMDVPAAGLLPGINGLQIGKVVQLQEDPDGENRILVRLPIVDNTARGVWTRVATLDAGKERGSFFLPEIDDEVLVGFINDDPRDAVCLGMLHSSAHPAPLNAQDVNHEKGFTTRSKMHIQFNDEKKTITIDTPAGNKVVLDEDQKSILIQDQNGNMAKFSESGIEMKSPKDIKIEATGKIDIKAGQALKIDGMSVAIAGQTSFEAKGATAKLEASGIAEVKGSLVKIN